MQTAPCQSPSGSSAGLVSSFPDRARPVLRRGNASTIVIREDTTMQRSSAIVIALLLAGSAALLHAQNASGQADAGWVALFDGKSLDNWTRIGDANWTIAEGAVMADKASGISYLVSKATYTD